MDVFRKRMREDNFMKSEYIVMGEYRKAGGFGGNKRGGFGGGRPGFGGSKPGFRRNDSRDDGPREMFPAKCSSCHKSCEIPFRPSGDRPVYCRDCFGAQESAVSDTRGRRDDRGSESRFPRKEYHASVFSAPKPLIEDKRMESLKRQLDDVSAKVDRILHILDSKNVVESIETKQPKKKSDISEVREAVRNIITDIKTAKKSAKEEEADTEKKTAKKRPTSKKA